MKKIIAIAFILLIAAAMLIATLHTPGAIAHRDYVSYWSAGKRFVARANPYDQAAVLRIEQSIGYNQPYALIMRNPPWAAAVVYPLGYLSALTGAAIWTMLLIFAALISIHLLYRNYGPIPISIYLFAPMLACIDTGQMTALSLLGLTVFLVAGESKPFESGVALTLLAFKPHLAFLFWPLLLIDSIRRKNFKLLFGLLVGIALLSAISTALDPHIWAQYSRAMQADHLRIETFPTISSLLRHLRPGRDFFYLQFVPMGLAIVWGGWYYCKNKSSWDWSNHGPLVIAISVTASPYSWFFDQILLLPAVIWVCHRSGSKPAMRILVGMNLAELILLRVCQNMHAAPYIFTSTLWLAWYLYGRYSARRVERYDAVLAHAL